MNTLLLDRCRGYLLAHAASDYTKEDKPPLRAVTISRETGAGGLAVAELLAKELEALQGNATQYPWAIFERNLARHVLADHRLSESLEKYLTEDTTNRVRDLVEDLLGIHPPTWRLVQHTNRTIRRLAMMGNAILIGRGGHLVTANLDHVFHVRLIAPLNVRIRRVAEARRVSQRRAAELIGEEDTAKARYIRRNFKIRLQDPLQFHLTINTGCVDFPAAARLIADVVCFGPKNSK